MGTIKNYNGGYTLIELTVVVFLIGLMLAFTIPRIQTSLLSDDLKTATRRMVGAVRTLKDKAIRDRKGYMLHLDTDSGRYWVEWDKMTEEERWNAKKNAATFPGNVRITDISRRTTVNRLYENEVIHFSKKGYVEYAVIYLSDDERVSTIVLSPFLGKAKTFDGRVDIEDI